MVDRSTITAAISHHARLMKLSSISDEECEMDGFLRDAASALDAAMAIPASTLADVSAKLHAVIEDAGCGLVAVDHVRMIANDVDGML